MNAKVTEPAITVRNIRGSMKKEYLQQEGHTSQTTMDDVSAVARGPQSEDKCREIDPCQEDNMNQRAERRRWNIPHNAHSTAWTIPDISSKCQASITWRSSHGDMFEET